MGDISREPFQLVPAAEAPASLARALPNAAVGCRRLLFIQWQQYRVLSSLRVRMLWPQVSVRRLGIPYTAPCTGTQPTYSTQPDHTKVTQKPSPLPPAKTHTEGDEANMPSFDHPQPFLPKSLTRTALTFHPCPQQISPLLLFAALALFFRRASRRLLMPVSPHSRPG